MTRCKCCGRLALPHNADGECNHCVSYWYNVRRLYQYKRQVRARSYPYGRLFIYSGYVSLPENFI